MKYFSIVFYLFCCAGLFAQVPHPAFRQYTVEQGLPSTEIYQVKQDSKGYIWFATNNGVSRFNGYEFENFSMNNGLPDNTVFEIFEDSKGRIWFQPLSMKLSYYENGKIHPYKYNHVIQQHLKNPFKFSFMVDDHDAVYMGLGDIGIYRVTAEGKMEFYKGTPQLKQAFNVTEPMQGGLVIGSIYDNKQGGSKGLTRIYFDTKKIKGELKLKNGIQLKNRVYARVLQLRKGGIALTYENKLMLIDDLEHYKVESFVSNVNWLYEDREGDLWVGTYQNGVFHVPGRNLNQKKQYLKETTVDGVLQDAEGGFWFATEGNGVYYAPSKKTLTYDRSAGLMHDYATCLSTDGEKIFAGMKNGYLHLISLSGSLKTYDIVGKGKPRLEIGAFFYDRSTGTLWMHGSGIQMCAFKTGNIKRWNKIWSFYDMMVDARGTYWTSNVKGVSYIDFSKLRNIQVTQGQHSMRAYALLEKKSNHIWYGTLNGLWQINLNDTSYINFTEKNDLLSKRISDMAYMPDSSLALATRGSGIIIYDMKKTYQIHVADKLGGDNVNKICVDGNVIWAATNHGVGRIEFKKPGVYDDYEVKNFTTFDGLASNEVSGIVKTNGYIWAATRKGISRIPVSEFDLQYQSYPLQITGVQMGDKSLPFQSSYELPYNHQTVKISFIALGYRDPGKMQYRYKMDGLDTGWTYTGNREIQFTTLPPNNYVFTLSVNNGNGNWTNHPVRIRFTVLTPVWRQWWFILAVTVGCIYILFLLLRYRFRRIQYRKEKSAHLERNLLNLRLKALQAQMNPHFIFNVMNSIQHFIAYKDEESANLYLSKFSRLMRTILLHSEKTTVTVAEEIKALELYLELECMRFDGSFTYAIETDKSLTPALVEIPAMLIQPYVENAIQHGIRPLPSGGKLRIHLSVKNNMLCCMVEDNGIGREKAALQKNEEHRSFGTLITQERLVIINQLFQTGLSENVVDLYDGQGNACGTRVEIFIPL